MNGDTIIKQARMTIDNLRTDGFSLDDLAAIFGVTRPLITKYTYHPEMMTLAEFQFLEKFYSDYQLRKSMTTKQDTKEGE